jgi:hypothetical protein
MELLNTVGGERDIVKGVRYSLPSWILDGDSKGGFWRVHFNPRAKQFWT